MHEKVVIVTGGSGLIGRSILADLRKKGMIAINADIQPAAGEDMNQMILCDITKTQSVEHLVEAVWKKYGRLDGLVNNAYPRTQDWGNRFEDILLNSWRENVDMQLNAGFYLTQKVVEKMKQQRKGSIVNIASIYGVVGNDFTVYENTGGMTSPAAYAAIKGAIVNFSRYLASYCGPYNIRVNCVSPGGVFNNQHAAFVQQYSHKVPLKRMAKPSEIAPPVSFLISDEASYITGHNLLVDGGWTAV